MSSPRLSILYRTYAGENYAARPNWYSKSLCFQSLLLAAERLEPTASVDLYVLHDGSLKDNPIWTAELETLLEKRGELIELERQGNSRSLLAAARRAAAFSPEREILLAEDDYLWLPESLIGMHRALNTTPADYVTGYDHPDRYLANNPCGPDLPHYYHAVHITPERHWRAVESTCMTFMTRSGTLAAGLGYVERYHQGPAGFPLDRRFFRHIQGLHPPETGLQRLLLGPIPSLNTHAHVPYLAPLIDWDLRARQIESITRTGEVSLA